METVHSKKLLTPSTCMYFINTSLVLRFFICSSMAFRLSSCHFEACKPRMIWASVKKRLVYASSKSEIAGKSKAGVVKFNAYIPLSSQIFS